MGTCFKCGHQLDTGDPDRVAEVFDDDEDCGDPDFRDFAEANPQTFCLKCCKYIDDWNECLGLCRQYWRNLIKERSWGRGAYTG